MGEKQMSMSTTSSFPLTNFNQKKLPAIKNPFPHPIYILGKGGWMDVYVQREPIYAQAQAFSVVEAASQFS